MPGVEQGLITRNERVSSEMYEIELVVPGISQESKPGQFVHVKLGNSVDPLLRRPLSLYDVDKTKGRITLLYKVVGKGTNLLTKANAGEFLDVMGPLGRGFSVSPESNNYVLVGGGVGIAPLVYLARELKQLHNNVTVLYGAENKEQLAAVPRLQGMDVNLWLATMDGSAGFKGLVTGLLKQKISSEKIDFIYTCGPEAMMALVTEIATGYNIQGEVSLEEYMACGVGACLGCARKLKSNDENYVKVCSDGPVFAINEVEF